MLRSVLHTPSSFNTDIVPFSYRRFFSIGIDSANYKHLRGARSGKGERNGFQVPVCISSVQHRQDKDVGTSPSYKVRGCLCIVEVWK